MGLFEKLALNETVTNLAFKQVRKLFEGENAAGLLVAYIDDGGNLKIDIYKPGEAEIVPRDTFDKLVSQANAFNDGQAKNIDEQHLLIDKTKTDANDNDTTGQPATNTEHSDRATVTE